MARPKKSFVITTMKVPLSFRLLVVEEAKKSGVDPSDYLVGKKVVPV
jgi:hypothetical protein